MSAGPTALPCVQYFGDGPQVCIEVARVVDHGDCIDHMQPGDTGPGFWAVYERSPRTDDLAMWVCDFGPTRYDCARRFALRLLARRSARYCMPENTAA